MKYGFASSSEDTSNPRQPTFLLEGLSTLQSLVGCSEAGFDLDQKTLVAVWVQTRS
jgi:hypothetical protein